MLAIYVGRHSMAARYKANTQQREACDCGAGVRTCVECRGVVLALAHVEGTLAVHLPLTRRVQARAGIDLAPGLLVDIRRACSACAVMDRYLSSAWDF